MLAALLVGGVIGIVLMALVVEAAVRRARAEMRQQPPSSPSMEGPESREDSR